MTEPLSLTLLVQELQKIDFESSRTGKEKLLREFPYPGHLKDLLLLAHNPYHNFFLSPEAALASVQAELFKSGHPGGAEEANWADWMYAQQALLMPLALRQLTPAQAVPMIYNAWLKFGNPLTDLLRRVLKRSLLDGVGVKMINKIFDNLIPTFDIQLAEKPDIGKLNLPAQMEEKFDGVRILAFVEADRVKFMTRGGFEILLPHLEADILANKLTPGLVLDGELIGDKRQKVSGMVNRFIKGTAPADGDKNFRFKIFDMLYIEEWATKICQLTCQQRRGRLCRFWPNTAMTQVVEAYLVHSEEEIIVTTNRIIENGGEGTIVKNLDSLYEFKRSHAWMKFKGVFECDLRVTGTAPGKGKREGFIGAVTCSTDDGHVVVDVGSGFNDDDLAAMNEESPMGKIMTIRYNMMVQREGSKTWSLFLPRFVSIRLDKTDTDTIDTIERGF